MSRELDNACLQVSKYLHTLGGIKIAPLRPLESFSDFPFSVCYASSGVIEFGSAQDKKGLHTLVVELHVARKDLPDDIQAAMGYGDSIPNLLMSKLINDNNWNHTIDTFKRISYTFGAMSWGEVSTLGFRFRVEEVKILSTIT